MNRDTPPTPPKQTRKNLISCGPEKLADALIDMAMYNEDANNIIQRLTAPTDEIEKRFKKKLTAIKRSRRFLSWREAPGFVRELSGLLEDLEDLEEGVTDSKTGIQLVSRFFECEQAVMEKCDDSSGMIGSIYRQDATRVFTKFANGCPDKKWLCQQLTKLYAGNDYGLRDCLLDSAATFLPEESLRNLVDQFWQLAEKGNDKYEQQYWFRGVEELAVQLGDAPLFEKARLVSWGKPGTAACLDIAEVYFNNGEPKIALAWIEKDPKPGSFQEEKRDLLLTAIYSELGDEEKVISIFWKRFRKEYSTIRLDELLVVIGQDKRDGVVAETVEEILAKRLFSVSNVQFLLQADGFDSAEEYLLKSAEQLDGNFYDWLLPLAQIMEEQERNLAASLLYRALLDSILERGSTKAYSHGVRYLRKLDKLALGITGWLRFITHEEYKNGVRKAHGLKRSFWGKYDK